MAFPKRKNLQEQVHQQMVIIGSRNSVKIKSAEEAFHLAFGKHFLVQGLNVGSGDENKLPFGDVDTYTKAFLQASNGKTAFPEADFWLGIAEGWEKMNGETIVFAWVVVLDGKGKSGRAKTASIFAPFDGEIFSSSALDDEVKSGKAFTHPLQEGNGDLGMMTNGIVSRKDVYKQAIFLGLIPFLQKKK